VLTDFLVRKIK